MVLINNVSISQLRDVGTEERIIADVESNPLYFQRLGVLDTSGNLIAASLGRITSEIQLIPKPGLSNFTIQKVIALLLKEQVRTAKEYGLNQTHAWTSRDPALMKHYGFEEREERSYILRF